MANVISDETIEYVGILAKLELSDEEKEAAADLFARDKIIDKDKYVEFFNGHDFSIEAIKQLAESQKVMPYMVIGRLQKEKYLEYKYFSKYKLRYKWAE